MNDLARRMVMDRQRRRRDNEMEDRRRDYARNGMYDGEDYARGGRRTYDRRRDMRLADDIGTEPEYPYETDGKQGVKGTGPYGIGGRLYSRGRDYDDRDYYEDDYADYDDYRRDGHHPSGLMRLKKKDFMKWERDLQNADGTKGKHFEAEHIKRAAEQLGVQYRDFDEKELCMTANMLYSDFCSVLKTVIPADKEVMAYVKLALAWLEDEDAPVEGSEKLALYYWCIVSDEE